ncbi:MAG: flavin reductase [Nitrososphaerota archaeon]|nr:flavin reductase [Nitrososphaerota archaeon]
MKVDPDLVHRLFYPQVPLVMAARSGKRVSAMPVVSYLSTSGTPPLVGVACKPESFTCKLALKARAFSLSVLDRKHLAEMSRLATLSGAEVKDKLAAAGLAHSAGTDARVPVLDEAVATLECRLLSAPKSGDHLILIGSVAAAYASEAFSGFWDYQKYSPILYTGWKGGFSLYEGPRRKT